MASRVFLARPGVALALIPLASFLGPFIATAIVVALPQIIAARGITTDIALRYPQPGPAVLPAPWIGGGTGTPVHTFGR